ncbi:hypothetical protein CAEBREN_23889 [Caenorhabditis brenneri]|uniref:Uncharacterized protein n=1 Tax=Caenorhabditis brenneri TaxID=135651 RepID=G0NDI7_CAEBE|nr:hypothetical protein CAEBREN_23889 [Caenorhabditis brenneri]
MNAQQLIQALPKVIVTKCSKDRSDVVGVRCPNGTYYLYIYDGTTKKFVAHKCSCQPRVTEMDLRPLYAAISEKLSCFVIFMNNTITRRIEQYTYEFSSDTFMEVKNTGLSYNPALLGESNLVCMMYGPNAEQLMIESDQYGFLRKQISRDTFNFKVTTRSEVKTLMMQSLEETDYEESDDDDYEDNYSDDEDSEYDPEDSDYEPSDDDLMYDEYIGTIAPFVLLDCAHHPGSVIGAFNYTLDTYDTFFYNEVAGRFVPMDKDCNCKFPVTEYSLVPKYVQKASDGKQVIHVHNLFTNIMEKYCYVHGEGLVQVDYPELVYFAGKTTTSAVILSISDPSPVVIMRGFNGRLFIETYSQKTNNFVSTGTKPVKTFLVQWKETAKKEQEQKRLESKAAASKKAAANKAADQEIAEKEACKDKQAPGLIEELKNLKKNYEELNQKLEKMVTTQEDKASGGAYSNETLTKKQNSARASEMGKKAVEEIHSQIKFPVITLDDTPKKTAPTQVQPTKVKSTASNSTSKGTTDEKLAKEVAAIFSEKLDAQELAYLMDVISLDDTPKKSEKVSSGNATKANITVSTQPNTDESSTSSPREPLKDITEESLSDSQFNDNRMREISSKRDKEQRDRHQSTSYIPPGFGFSTPSFQPFGPLGSMMGDNNMRLLPIYKPYSSQQVQQGSFYMPIQPQGGVSNDKKQQQQGSAAGPSSSQKVQQQHPQQKQNQSTMESMVKYRFEKLGNETPQEHQQSDVTPKTTASVPTVPAGTIQSLPLNTVLLEQIQNLIGNEATQELQQLDVTPKTTDSAPTAPAGTVQNGEQSDGNSEKPSKPQTIKLGNLNFVQDPKDSQKWIITNEAEADKKAEPSVMGPPPPPQQPVLQPPIPTTNKFNIFGAPAPTYFNNPYYPYFF